ncbi:MAG: hypothetical protein R3F11_23190 [Verrucomicrobiales bacterium]
MIPKNPIPFTFGSAAAAALALTAASAASAAPDRDAFAKEDRPVEGVPVEAFELGDESLQIEVWAQSPMIFSPVAMDCDAQGRLWCTEGIDYNAGRRVDAGQSIIVLEDKDGDGKADSSHVFVTEKNLRPAPLGIAVFDNRIVLSATPSIIVFTDVDRDARFDPAVDKREEFLTGFQNRNHDHTLHAVVGAPSGQWHFSYGNCGADIQTKDGRHFLSGCYYGYPEAIGKPSSDGHVYVGGVTMRVNPDGTGLTPTAHNMRNPHDLFVTAFGDVLQSDNDDPAHCRSSWVMEHGNFGYADLRDGGRSWEEVAKTWEEPSGLEPRPAVLPLALAREHRRVPARLDLRAGSPTGNVFIEDDTTGLSSTYLVSCAGAQGSDGYARRGSPARRSRWGGTARSSKLKESERGQHFLPTDLVLGTDGSLFLADFYNDTVAHESVSGAILPDHQKGRAEAGAPGGRFRQRAGKLAALRSPAVSDPLCAAAPCSRRVARLPPVGRRPRWRRRWAIRSWSRGTSGSWRSLASRGAPPSSRIWKMPTHSCRSPRFAPSALPIPAACWSSRARWRHRRRPPCGARSRSRCAMCRMRNAPISSRRSSPDTMGSTAII